MQRSALVVAPTLDLMNQWYDALVTAFGEKVGLLAGGYHEPGDLTVSTYGSAWMHLDRLGARWGLFIYDECHHLPDASFLSSAEGAIAPFRLGLTATLERSDGREALVEVLGFWRKETLQSRIELLASAGPKNLVLAVPWKLRGGAEDEATAAGAETPADAAVKPKAKRAAKKKG